MKTRTRINPDHPWNQFKKARQDTKRALRKRSNADLYRTAKIHGIKEPPGKRSPLIDAILECFDRDYRDAWKINYGWDFEEVRDFNKLKARIDAGELVPISQRKEKEDAKGN